MDILAMRQIHTMSAKYPQFMHFRSTEGNLIFKGTLQPKATMPNYTVYIEYRGNDYPRVWVTKPALIIGTPHVYSGGNLCLYKPGDFEWTAGKPICDSIVPWTSLWLYFYEVWKTKRIWYGPEAPHDNNTPKNE